MKSLYEGVVRKGAIIKGCHTCLKYLVLRDNRSSRIRTMLVVREDERQAESFDMVVYTADSESNSGAILFQEPTEETIRWANEVLEAAGIKG